MRFDLRRVIIVYAIELLVLTVLSIIGFYIGPLFVNESMITSLENELRGATGLGPNYIFLHNLVIDTLMAIPVVGPFFFVFTLATTGFVLGVFVSYALNSPIGLVLSLLVTMFFPHGIIELFAYAFSTSGSLLFTGGIINTIRRRGSVNRDGVIAFIIYYVISVILLYIAANVEYFEITALKGIISGMFS
ncbi:stage II sporulation protein M [Vulcanisaeta souniana]|uniref:Stage II sporulation protein M n=1 Tax=Vulcanisaeta souniana JCM 11219 TaxID=1293586 RepID=A0A830E3E6_9CREN|nr:stage II sporulation protein M [Vulcanisaeta souniana]BDR93185.1 hypothetical protein Vsou_22780 [Vulcanisaeta souniana JCM 11219]GGI78257.1 hypothetical protein GCM10007112_13860 [Vulcanisaeta souniana JCM 11219]